MNHLDENNLAQDDNSALDDFTSTSSSDQPQQQQTSTTPASYIINKTAQILIETFNASSLPSAIVESLKPFDQDSSSPLDQDPAAAAAAATSTVSSQETGNQTSFFAYVYSYFFHDSLTGQALKQFQHLFDSLNLFLVYFFEWLSTTPLSNQTSKVSFEIKILSALLFLLLGLVISLFVVWGLFGSTIKDFYSNQEVYKYTPTNVYDSYFRRKNFVSVNQKKRKIN